MASTTVSNSSSGKVSARLFRAASAVRGYPDAQSMRITAVLTIAGLLLAGCAAVDEGPKSEVRVDHLPPENLDIIEALVRSGDIPLSVHPLCEELAGPKAKTIGEYTALLLAMQVEGGT